METGETRLLEHLCAEFWEYLSKSYFQFKVMKVVWRSVNSYFVFCVTLFLTFACYCIIRTHYFSAKKKWDNIFPTAWREINSILCLWTGGSSWGLKASEGWKIQFLCVCVWWNYSVWLAQNLSPRGNKLVLKWRANTLNHSVNVNVYFWNREGEEVLQLGTGNNHVWSVLTLFFSVCSKIFEWMY